MQFFYDGQIRRYLAQTIRIFSNFVVKYGDGRLVQVPVIYGDSDRQVASLQTQNTPSTIQSAPRIAIYITGLELNKSMLSDATYIGKLHIRERGVNETINPATYTQGQGRNYTVERLMPTPYLLKMKADIWSANTDQKLQLLEQILVLFNPSLELQTTDNYIDWTSISVLNLTGSNWSSRAIPRGTEEPIEISTLDLEAPIWISPPAKVKHMGVITNIITSIHENFATDNNSYIEGLGLPLGQPTTTLGTIDLEVQTSAGMYNMEVYNGQARLLNQSDSLTPAEPTLGIPTTNGGYISWNELFLQLPGTYVAGASKIFLSQPNGTNVVGTIAVNPTDSTTLQINYLQDTIPTNTNIDSQGLLQGNPLYGTTGTQYRSNSPGTFDAIIDPYKTYPGNGITNLVAGDRFLLVEDIATTLTDRTYIDANGVTQPGVMIWGPLLARANDIIEWTGTQWNVVFNSSQETNVIVYQTNIYTGVQYVWNGINWAKSFEGEYKAGAWYIQL